MARLEHFLTPSSLQQDRSVECFLLSASIEIILENSRSTNFNQRAVWWKAWPFLDFDRDGQFFSFLVSLTWTVYKSLKRTYAVSNWKHVIHLHWPTRGKSVPKLVHRSKIGSLVHVLEDFFETFVEKPFPDWKKNLIKGINEKISWYQAFFYETFSKIHRLFSNYF